MIIRDMNLSLIIACFVIILVLIILQIFISYKAEKKDEWEKIKDFADKINKKTKGR